MAYLGKLFIAGEECEGGSFKSGAVYSLSEGCNVSHIYKSENNIWVVEFDKSNESVVARCKKKLDYEELMSESFEQIQRALDIMSVKGISSATLEEASRQNIGIYWKEGKSILRLYSMHDLPMSMSLNVVHTDSGGNEIPQPVPEEPIWSPTFRYYRLSQSSTDLFEAYRNLFLSFEALLNEIFPIKSKEREGAWLRRCLGDIGKTIGLEQFAPKDNDDPVAYIIKSQYKDVRCRLLHAKFPKAELPHSSLNPREVAEAYEKLIRIWRHIACHYLNVPSGGGVITYAGFEMMMNASFSSGVSISYTGDDSSPKKDDIEVSPKGAPVFEMKKSNYSGVLTPGIVGVEAIESIDSKLRNYEQPIFRACVTMKSTLFCIAHIKGGLMLSGIDEWEIKNAFRLVNSDQPNVVFKT